MDRPAIQFHDLHPTPADLAAEVVAGLRRHPRYIPPKFFYDTRNRLSDFIPTDETLLKCLRLIRVEDFRRGHRLSLIMDDEQNRAVAFLQAK